MVGVGECMSAGAGTVVRPPIARVSIYPSAPHTVASACNFAPINATLDVDISWTSSGALTGGNGFGDGDWWDLLGLWCIVQ